MSDSVIRLLQLGIISIFLFVGGCGDIAKTDNEYVRDAQALYDSKDIHAAVIELKNALQENSHNIEARVLLGRIYALLGQSAAAEKELDRARELGIPFRDIAVNLGDALLHQGKATELINEFQVGQYDSAELKAIKTILLGEAFYQLKSYDGAANYFSLALKSKLVRSRAFAGQSLISLIKGDLSGAEALAKQSVAADNKNPKSWMLMADVHRAQGLNDKAIADYEKVTLLTHTNQDYLYQAAMRQLINEYLKVDKTEKAEESLKALKRTFYKQQIPNDLQLTHVRAVLAFQKQQYEQAYELANKVLLVERTHLGAMLLVGTIDALTGRYEQAGVNLERFLQFVPQHIQARKILAYTQLNNSQKKEALNTLASLVSDNEKPDAETLALVARAALRAGEVKQSSRYLQQALEQNPADNKIRLALAQSYMMQGYFEQAIQELALIDGSDDTELKAQLLTVQTYITAKNYTAAFEALEAFQARLPGEPLPVSLKGTVALLMGDYDEAKRQFGAALHIDSSYAPALRSLAMLATVERDYSSAKARYKDALIATPDNVYLYRDYASLLFELNEFDEAETFLKKALELGTSSDDTVVMLARMYLRQGRASEALSVLRAEDGSFQAELSIEIGNAQMMLGEYQLALATYQQVAATQANSAVAHYLVATAQMALKNYRAANKELVLSLQTEPYFIASLVASIEIALLTKKEKKAQVFLDQLEKTAPKYASLGLLKAELAMHQKKPQQAVIEYERLYKEDANTFVLQKLVQAYWGVGKQEKALAVLQSADKISPDNAQITYLLATAYSAAQQAEAAIAAYKRTIILNKYHIFALNNLAWLVKDEDPQQALIYAKQALELSPEDKSVRDTLKEINKRL